MEYERIQPPQKGGGLSPAKLRSMLTGVQKKRMLAEEMDSSSCLTSQLSGVYDPGSDLSESYKDVDVVHEHLQSSPSIGTKSELETKHDIMIASSSSSPFEFQKSSRTAQKAPSVPFSKPAPSKWDDAQKWIASPTSNRPKTSQSIGPQGGMRKTGGYGHGGKKPATKVVGEVPEEKFVAFEEVNTKKMNPMMVDMDGKASHESTSCLSQQDSSVSNQTETAPIPSPSFARSVSMRDMGTEMTPITSKEPSRTGTPVKVKSPVHSPKSSRPSSNEHTDSKEDSIDLRRKEVSEKEKQMKTRKEIMELGVQLGKRNVAAWARQDGDERSASVMGEQVTNGIVETRAEAWEEAEKAKYMARFEREEMKIQAWENHQKAKSEAELRKTEVEVERMRAKAQEKLMKKLADARHKAEEKRTTAENKMSKKSEHIGKRDWISSKFSCWGCCS